MSNTFRKIKREKIEAAKKEEAKQKAMQYQIEQAKIKEMKREEQERLEKIWESLSEEEREEIKMKEDRKRKNNLSNFLIFSGVCGAIGHNIEKSTS